LGVTSLPFLWIQLTLTATVILIAATLLTKNADIIAFKTGLGRSFVGVVLLATATSLPELGTGVTSVTLIGGTGGADLAAGDAFGSNVFNLLIIGIIDLLWKKGSILRAVGPTPATVGVLSIVMISLAAAGVFIHTQMNFFDGFIVSPVSIVLILIFVAALYYIYREEKSSESNESDADYSDNNFRKAIIVYTLSALVVVVASIWLAQTGDKLAHSMGWEQSFVGNQFLALTTSLPELAASIAAIRIMAPELAITNLLGSNLFNMGFVLFIDDLAYTSGPLWAIVSPVHILTALAAVLMTTVVLLPIIGKTRTLLSKNVTFEAIFLISLYIIVSVLVFFIGRS
jgi:cation:H+ antiporter